MGLQRLAHEYTEGDQLPPLTGKFPYDITGHTIIVSLKQPSGAVIQREATVAVGADGAFSFAWEDGDLLPGLNQTCEIVDLDADEKPLTPPIFLIDVRARQSTLPVPP